MYLQCQEINQASCDIARRCADKWGTIVAGGIVQTAAYRDGLGKEEVHKELREGLEVLIHNNIDLIIVEYFHNIEEMEWAIELALSYDKPVAATMCMGPCGDGKVGSLSERRGRRRDFDGIYSEHQARGVRSQDGQSRSQDQRSQLFV